MTEEPRCAADAPPESALSSPVTAAIRKAKPPPAVRLLSVMPYSAHQHRQECRIRYVFLPSSLNAQSVQSPSTASRSPVASTEIAIYQVFGHVLISFASRQRIFLRTPHFTITNNVYENKAKIKKQIEKWRCQQKGDGMCDRKTMRSAGVEGRLCIIVGLLNVRVQVKKRIHHEAYGVGGFGLWAESGSGDRRCRRQRPPETVNERYRPKLFKQFSESLSNTPDGIDARPARQHLHVGTQFCGSVDIRGPSRDGQAGQEMVDLHDGAPVIPGPGAVRR